MIRKFAIFSYSLILGFFWAIGIPNKKIKSFQKILKKHHTGELHKKGTILHQTPLITFFLTHPVCIQDRVYILHFHTRCVFCTTLCRVEFSVLLYIMNFKCPWVCTVYCVTLKMVFGSKVWKFGTWRKIPLNQKYLEIVTLFSRNSGEKFHESQTQEFIFSYIFSFDLRKLWFFFLMFYFQVFFQKLFFPWLSYINSCRNRVKLKFGRARVHTVYTTGCPNKHGNSVTNSISSFQLILVKW